MLYLVMVSKLEDAFVNYTREWVLLVNKLFFLFFLLSSWNLWLNGLHSSICVSTLFHALFSILNTKEVMEHLLLIPF